jgi:hypothetical protein
MRGAALAITAAGTRAGGDFAIAHHAFDQPGADAVLLVQRAAPRARQAAGLDGGEPGRLRRLVLHESARHGADRRGAEADQEGRGIGRVALEIPPQRAGGRRHRHRIAGQGEMVEPDGDIARPGQYARRGLGLVQALRGIRQVLGADGLLVRLHPGHMRVAEDRHAVGAAIGGEAGRGLDLRDTLRRQPVDQVHVDAGHAQRAQPAHGGLDLRRRLHAPDAFLHRRADVLHAEARPRQPDRAERIEQPGIEAARVEFGGDLRPRSEGEQPAQRGRQPAQPGGTERRRRAPAQVQRRDAGVGGQQRGGHRGLARQPRLVAVDPRGRPRDCGVAAAIPAQRVAERHMGIERQRIAGPGLAQPCSPGPGIERPEMRRGRVAGVARQRHRGVAQEGLGGQGARRGHARMVAARSRARLAVPQARRAAASPVGATPAGTAA